MQKIPFETLTLEGDGYHILIDVTIFDKQFKMVIDTGASKTVLDQKTLLASGIDESLIQSTNIKSTGLGTNDMESFILDLPYLKIHDWKSTHTQVAVLDLSSINYAYEQMGFPTVIGVLGGDILMKYGALINYKKQHITLNERARSR